MATTTSRSTTRQNRLRDEAASVRADGARPRVRGSVRAKAGARATERNQYDLLTAALVGAAIGASTTLLLRRNSRGIRPLMPALRAARTGARMARDSARVAWHRGVDAWDRIPRDAIEDRVRDYVDSAKDTIDHLVEHELKDLRRAIQRRRKKLGF